MAYDVFDESAIRSLADEEIDERSNLVLLKTSKFAQGWIPLQTTSDLTVVTDPGHGGLEKPVLKVVANSSAVVAGYTGAIMTGLTKAYVKVIPGKSYRVSGLFSGPVGKNPSARFSAYYLNDSGTYLSALNAPVSGINDQANSAGATQIDSIFTVPSSAYRMYIAISFAANTGSLAINDFGLFSNFKVKEVDPSEITQEDIDFARDRANHSGYQLANTISNFDAAVQAAVASATEGPLWKPSDNGLLAANFAPRHIATSFNPPTGFAFLNRVKVPAGVAITNVHLHVAGAGAGLTDAKVAVYEANGTQSGISANQNTAWQSTGGKSIALTTPIPSQSTSRYVWVAFSVAGTTLPYISVSNSTHSNMNLSGANLNSGYISGAGALPATVTMSNMVVYYEFWIGLS